MEAKLSALRILFFIPYLLDPTKTMKNSWPVEVYCALGRLVALMFWSKPGLSRCKKRMTRRKSAKQKERKTQMWNLFVLVKETVGGIFDAMYWMAGFCSGLSLHLFDLGF